MGQKRYFGTDGIRGRIGTGIISPDWFLKLGWAVGRVLSSNKNGKVIIGKDTRISGYMFESALEAGLVASGIDVYLLGPMTTPGIAYLTKTLQADAGIVISASHNSYNDNGIKFFSQRGTKLDDEIEHAIEEKMHSDISIVAPSDLGKAVRVKDAMGRYIEFCKSTFPLDTGLNGMKIVLDCANGAGYNTAPHVFQELGATVIPYCISPDGLNINQDCGATSPQFLAKKVVEHKACLGIALDGDGDRVIMVDHQGNIVDGDEMVYIITLLYKSLNKDVGGVAGTLMSNLGLERAIGELKLPFIRTNVGDRYIIEELTNRNWLVGGESSGHIICRDAHSTGDGIIAALRVLAACILFGQTLSDLRSHIKKMPQVLINVPVSTKNLLQTTKVKKAIDCAEADLRDTGRVLLRASGTEPLVRVMVEGEDPSKIQIVANELSDIVSNLDKS